LLVILTQLSAKAASLRHNKNPKKLKAGVCD